MAAKATIGLKGLNRNMLHKKQAGTQLGISYITPTRDVAGL